MQTKVKTHQKLMGCRKNCTKKHVYSDNHLHWKGKKISNNQSLQIKELEKNPEFAQKVYTKGQNRNKSNRKYKTIGKATNLKSCF